MGWLEDLSAGASGVVNTVGGAVTNAANTVGGYVSGAFNAGVSTVTNAANAGAGAVTNAANQAQAFISPPPSTQSSNSGAVRSDSTNTYTGYVKQESTPVYVEQKSSPLDLITMGVGNNLYASPTNQNSQSQYTVVQNAPTVLPPEQKQFDIIKAVSFMTPLTIGPAIGVEVGKFIVNNKDNIVNKYNEITSPYVTDKKIYESRPQKSDMVDDIITVSKVTPFGVTGIPIIASAAKGAYDWYTQPFQQVKEGTVTTPSQNVNPLTTRLDLTMPQYGKDVLNQANSIYNKYGGSNINQARTVIEKKYEEVKPKVIQTGIDLVIEPQKVKQSIFPDKPYSNEYEVIPQTSESKGVDKLITISKFSPLAITGMPMFAEGIKGLYDSYITPNQQLKGQGEFNKRLESTTDESTAIPILQEGLSKGYIKKSGDNFAYTQPLTKVDTYNMILSDTTTSKIIPKDEKIINEWSGGVSNTLNKIPVVNMIPQDWTKSFAKGVIEEVRDRPFDIATDVALTVVTLPLGGEGGVAAKGATTALKGGSRLVRGYNYIKPFATPSNILTGAYVASAGSNIAFSDNKSETAGRESVHLLANIAPIHLNPMRIIKTTSIDGVGSISKIGKSDYGMIYGKDVNTGSTKAVIGNLKTKNTIIYDSKVGFGRVKPEKVNVGQPESYVISDIYKFKNNIPSSKPKPISPDVSPNIGKQSKYSTPDTVIKAQYKFVDNTRVNKPIIENNRVKVFESENRIKVKDVDNRVKVFESENRIKVKDIDNRVKVFEPNNRIKLFEGNNKPTIVKNKIEIVKTDTPPPPKIIDTFRKVSIFEPDKPPKFIDNTPYIKPDEPPRVKGGKWIGAAGGAALGFTLPNIGGLLGGGLSGSGGGGGGGSNRQGQRGFTETFDIGTGIGNIGILEGGLSLKKKRVNPYGGK